MDLYEELRMKTKKLDASIKLLRQNGTKLAEAEMHYKILLREECLRMKDAGMAVGMIELTCYGIPSVARLRFERDVAKATYTANLESVKATKLEMRLIEEQIQREWGACE